MQGYKGEPKEKIMATMQEYLEEMARRQAAGWTPGVPNRYLGALPTSYAPFSNLGALWAGSQPKVNLSDIAAASETPDDIARREARRKAESLSQRKGTGNIGKTVKSIAPMLSAISKVAGPLGVAAEMLRSEPVSADQSAESLAVSQAWQDANPNWTVPSQDELVPVEEVYPPGTPGATLPSFTVTPDAGGAVGGPPGGADKYGPSGYEGERIPPEGFRQIAPDTVIAASDFEVGPTSTAQVGGIQSIIDRGVDKFNDEVQSWKDFYNRPAEEKWGPQALAAKPTLSKIDKLGNTNMWGQNVNPTLNEYTGTMLDTPTDFTSPFMDIWDHQYMSPQDATYSQALKSKLMSDTFGPLGTALYSVGQLPQEFYRYLQSDDPNAYTGIGGTLAQMHAYMGEPVPANVRQHVDDLIEKNVLGITTPDVTPTTFSPLASPDISAQAMIDEATARQIAQDMALPDEQQRMLASNVPSVPVSAAPVSAPMAPRQDAMPAAPAGPTQAEIEAQIAAAEKAHRDQQASARQALKDFMASRAFQEEGASIPAGLIDVATQVDSFANIAEAGSGYQGGYEGMSGFEGYR